MINQIPINLLRFVLLLLAQILVFSNVNFSSFINPYVFPLFILLLPFETPRWLLMIVGFAAGFTLDIFLGSAGMHAAACLLIGYLRPFLINIITPKGTVFEISPQIHSQGPAWFAVYTGIAMFIYLTFYFLIEAATFLNFFLLLVKIILSTVFSTGAILTILFLFSSRKKRRYV